MDLFEAIHILYGLRSLWKTNLIWFILDDAPVYTTLELVKKIVINLLKLCDLHEVCEIFKKCENLFHIELSGQHWYCLISRKIICGRISWVTSHINMFLCQLKIRIILFLHVAYSPNLAASHYCLFRLIYWIKNLGMSFMFKASSINLLYRSQSFYQYRMNKASTKMT